MNFCVCPNCILDALTDEVPDNATIVLVVLKFRLGGCIGVVIFGNADNDPEFMSAGELELTLALDEVFVLIFVVLVSVLLLFEFELI